MDKKIYNEIINLPKISETIKYYNLSAIRHMSQNFILDLNITNSIVKTAGNLKKKEVIEIGPGPGALTRAIIISGAKKIIALEKDKRFLKALLPIKKILENKIVIINEDALHISLKEIIKNNNLKNAVVISNLPYSISTKLLIKWLPFPKEIKQMTLMFQKEVGERIVAKKGTKKYGRLSVITNLYSNPEIKMKINQKSFFPQPKVNSVIVQIKPKKHENLKFSKSNLEKITHILFHQRRKKIKSSIKSFGNPELICKLAKIDSSMRPEQITPEGFARLSIILNSKLN